MKDQGDLLRQMAQLQQQYWDGWRDMAGPAMSPDPRAAATAPWQDGLAAWQRGLAGGMPGAGFAGPAQNEAVERMLVHGKQYLALLQGMMAGQGFQAGSHQFDPQAWIAEMRELQKRYMPGLTGGMAAFEAMPWFGGVDTAQIEQMVKAFTNTPMRGVQQELHSWLGVPTFGLAREHQERKQDLLRAWLDYQVANHRYNEMMLGSTARTLDVLESKLAEREEPRRRIESAKALYDLWIDAAEDAFAELALSPTYRELYGELTNAQMRVRAGLNAEFERFAAQFGLPTRTEVDSIAKQLHELKHQLRRLRGAEAETKRSSGTPASTTADAAGERKSKAVGKDKSKPRKASASATRKRSAAKPAASSSAGKTRTDDAGSKGKRATKRKAKTAPVLQSTARKSAKGG